MRHIVVCGEPGAFFGWPANCGLWTWGEKLVVGFTRGTYKANPSGHSMDPDQPHQGVLARSLDGGETWSREEPRGAPRGVRLRRGGPADRVPGAARRLPAPGPGDPLQGLLVRGVLRPLPAMVRLRNGRLCVVYGYRGEPSSMRARLSADDGVSWGREIVLRDDARNWVMGYP